MRLGKIAKRILRRLQDRAVYRSFQRSFAPQVTLREATDSDLIQVHQWLNATRNFELQRSSNLTEWVAFCRDQIAGFVQLVRYPADNELYKGFWLFSLNVKPVRRGMGIGTALTRAVIDRARIEGAPALDLLVFEDNVRAIRLYAKMGFESVLIPALEPSLEKEREVYGHRRLVMRKVF